MAEKQYNFIYSKLVTSQDDVIGLLAYSIYKRHKIEYIEDFKKKLAFLEGEENNERLAKKQKEKDLADYRRLQTEEKRRIALNDFEQINEDNYKQLKRLEMEDDDFIKYAEYWIQEYKRQGKNITPLLLELKRYKKNYSLY